MNGEKGKEGGSGEAAGKKSKGKICSGRNATERPWAGTWTAPEEKPARPREHEEQGAKSQNGGEHRGRQGQGSKRTGDKPGGGARARGT